MNYFGEHRKTFSEGFKDGTPIILGYVPVSFAFGVTAASGGIPPWIVILISATNFTSAGQLMGATLIIANAPLVEIGLATFILNIRYLIMSMSLSQRLEQGMTLRQKLISGLAITDELFAIASLKKGDLSFRYLTGLFSGPCLGWTFGTVLGAFASDLLPITVQQSMGIALYAMFIALLIPAAKHSKPITVIAVISLGVVTIFTYTPALHMVSSGYAVIAGTVISAAIGAYLFPVADENLGEAAEGGEAE